MKYPDLKNVTLSMVKEHMSHGASQEEAESRVLKAGIAMLNDQKIGVIDLKLMFQILGYDFTGELAKNMEEVKGIFRDRYGLDKGIQDLMSKGFKEDLAKKAVVRGCYDSFIEGNIEGPELLDGLLWSLGYRLTEQFFLDYYKGKKPKLAYEEDE